MKKVALVLLAAVALVGFGFGARVLAKTDAADNMTLQCGTKMPVVQLTHAWHAKTYACDTCHHTLKGLRASDRTHLHGLPPEASQAHHARLHRAERHQEPVPRSMHRLPQGAGQGTGQVR